MWGLNKTPSAVRRHAPLMGEHNREVLCGILGLNDGELAELEARQVVY
jgi:crotonobetainyl-CoA:carnitine CoA-transferase CaiB-like acyl-CoA transferase